MTEFRPLVGQGLPLAPERQADTDAARRALSMQRLVGNGMDHDDAARLHELAAAGVAWADAAVAVGEAKLALASAAGSIVSARTYAWHAAAAFRFGQSAMIFDDAPKIALYRRALDAFVLGADLADPPYDKSRFRSRPANFSAG